MGRLFKRKGVYYADVRAEGFGRPSLRTSDRFVAKERLRGAELGTLWAAPEAKQAGKYLAHAIDEMLAVKKASTAASYRGHSLPVLRILGTDIRLSDITRAKIGEYIGERRAESIKAHTIAKELVVIRQAMLEAKARGDFDGDVAALVPKFKGEYQPKTNWLSPAQFGVLIGLAPAHRRSWLMLQVYTSANRGEVGRMTWAHIDMGARLVTVPGTKRDSRLRIVPMHEALHAFLGSLDRSQALVRPWPSVNGWMLKACLRAKPKLPHTTPNDLRRTFGSWLVQAGVDLLHVARLMGNSPDMVARVYGQHSRASLSAAIGKLPSF